MKIGVTGAGGFLGFHLRAFLYAQGGHEVRLATRETFADPAVLDRFVRDLDGVAHLAGMNRGDEASLEAANASLASELVAAFRRTGAQPALVFANSTHVERETGYGRGKRAAAERLAEWAAGAGTSYSNFVLPNVFGEFGRPFYNSVVATFCHQLANGHTPEIQIDAELELLHAQAVASCCTKALMQGESGTIRPAGKLVKVSELLDRLRYMHDRYVAAKVIPDLSDPLDLRLFNTLRSYLYPSHYPVSLDLRSDARGALFEAVKVMQGPDLPVDQSSGHYPWQPLPSTQGGTLSGGFWQCRNPRAEAVFGRPGDFPGQWKCTLLCRYACIPYPFDHERWHGRAPDSLLEQ